MTLKFTIGLIINEADCTNCSMLIAQSYCFGCGCFDEHIDLKCGIMGGSCNLMSASACSLFLY
jgi:hypothetical protein